ncbi:MAG: helix-turn-helix domain-containing protein [Saprospiraceae bacterium]
MLKESDAVKLIFGLKVQHLRREQNLSYHQLSERTGLAISYLHDIEKGKKYPKYDKILALAKALDTDYNYLVSLQANKKLKPIIDLLHSDFLKIFPLETFGVSMPKLLELLVEAPDKINAFISTVIKIIRNYNLQGEDFYKAALRSYQSLHDNYFEDLEKAVRDFRKKCGVQKVIQFSPAQLEQLLEQYFGISVDRKTLPQNEDLRIIRSFFSRESKTLFLNANLSSTQESYLIAKELGFQFMYIEDRPYETHMTEIESFDKLMNYFRASYFAVALLMDEQEMIQEVEKMATWTHWDANAFRQLLYKYDVSPESLLQRLANILPKHFGIKDLFFLRFFTGPDMERFEMTKEMHLSQLHNPHANQLDEHYCRRWISIHLIRQLKASENLSLLCDAQISRYWGTSNAYLSICLAKPDHDNPQDSTSVTLGLLVTDRLRQLFRFLDNDAQLKVKEVHNTCERCGITDCGARAVPPVLLQQRKAKEKVKSALARLDKIVEASYGSKL